MAHRYRNPRTVICTVFIILCLSSNLFAIEYSTDDRYSVAVGDTIHDDLALLSDECAIDGVISNDLLICCNNFSVSGKIAGNINSASRKATIRGTVGNSARMAAQIINIDGHIGNNLLVFGEEIYVDRDATVGNDVNLFGQIVRVYSEIGGNLQVYGKDVTISGLIDGNVYVEGEDIYIDKLAQINGNITYKSPKEIDIDDGASIAGEIEWKKNKPKEKEESDSGSPWGFDIVLTFCSLVTGLLLILLFKRHTNLAVKAIQKNVLLATGVGFVGLCVTPVAIVLLMVTVLGIPAAILVTFAYASFFYIGKIYVAIAIGKFGIKLFMTGTEPKNGWCLLLGLFILTILFNIPIVGWIAYLVTVFAGFGAIILALRECREMIKVGSIAEK